MEEDFEIECLDEDAEIVQQCVQTASQDAEYEFKPADVKEKVSPLLVERTEKPKKKKKKVEDTDYDPSKDQELQHMRLRKRKSQVPPPVRVKDQDFEPSKYSVQKMQIVKDEKEFEPTKFSVQKLQKRLGSENLTIRSLSGNDDEFSTTDVAERNKMNIRIPDYEDPLCLPVRAITCNKTELEKLRIWNNLCLDRFKMDDRNFRPDSGVTKRSRRTLAFKAVDRKSTGAAETRIWGKISVESDDQTKKVDVFQCFLPKYREKKLLNYFSSDARNRKPFRRIDEVLLTREQSKEGDTLVVYKNKEKLSSVYTLVKKKTENSSSDESEEKQYLQEVTNCLICAPCYQTSWRGVRKIEKKDIKCAVCGRTFISVYNLLSHLKTHPSADVKERSKHISRTLASILSYHYKCRVCQDAFPTIKELRQHVTTHQGSKTFMCEVGNHLSR